MSKAAHLDIILRRGHGDKAARLAAVACVVKKTGLSRLPFKTVHIAGTNGKGTAAALTSAALRNGGYKTGLFISPHVRSITERIQINNRKISLGDLDFYIEQVLSCEPVPLNFFDIIFLAALLYFRDKKVDYAVIECGIGGLKDSTNLIKPVLSVITSVSVDHSDILGKTIKEIAAQKAGIIKQKTPCVAGLLPASAKAVVAAAAKAKNAPLIFAAQPKILKTDYEKPSAEFLYKKEVYKFASPGGAQLINAAVVLEAATLLGLSRAAVRKALEGYKMPGRFEISRLGGKIIVKDGAHNAAALKNFVETYAAAPFARAESTLIYAASADKDYKAAAKILAPRFKNIVLTCVDEKKGVPPEELLKYFKKAVIMPQKQLTESALLKLKGNIIVLGSFYLCAKIPAGIY